MFKKMFLTLLLCLTLVPATTSFAGGFVSPSEDSGLYKKVGWKVEVYQELEDGKRKRLCQEWLSDKGVHRQGDGTVVLSSEHITIIEPADEGDPITLKLKDVKVEEGKVLTENFALESGSKEYILPTTRRKVFVVTKMVMTRLNNGWKSNAILY
jgi:hypothetical protein